MVLNQEFKKRAQIFLSSQQMLNLRALPCPSDFVKETVRWTWNSDKTSLKINIFAIIASLCSNFNQPDPASAVYA